MTNTTTAQIVKTYTDGTFEIDTMPVHTARAHVASRVAAPAHFGLTAVTVRIGRATHAWQAGAGWSSVKECDNAATEHPGFPCAHPAAA